MEEVVSLPTKEVYESLKTSPKGLTGEEANRRLTFYGPNRLISEKRVSMAYRFFRNLKDLFGILLLGASVLSFISGNFLMAYVLVIVVLINTVFSVFQEWRAEKATEALRHWMPEYAKVIREGELERVLVEELVPGDIIVLEEGDRVPADSRLIEAFDLWTNNIPLTGESEPQPRNADPATIEETAYLYAPNLVLMSTSVVKGRGKGVVFATGMNTRFGQVAGLTLAIKDPLSPLQKEIGFTAKTTFIISIALGFAFFLLTTFLLRVDIFTSIIFMIGVMTALVPEGLQVTVSSALAISTLQMLKQNVLVKRLSAVQTLGSVTVIATDKTGTITTGAMTVTKIWVPDVVVEVSGIGYSPVGEFTVDGKPLEKEETNQIEKLLEVSALCNNAKVVPPSDKNPLWDVIGDTTDGALLVAALKYGLNIQNTLAQKPIIHMIPFTSERKMMTSIHENTDKNYVYTKGSPKTILSICDRILVDDKVEKLTDKQSSFIEEKISEFASEGLRIIAVAYNELLNSGSLKLEPENVEKNMVFLGLAAMKDPPRPEIKESLKMARQAGIRVVIITGDYGLTALAIAREIGLIDDSNSSESDNSCRGLITGGEIEHMSDQKIVKEIKKGCSIFALVTPLQKLRIVKALRQNAEIVAVTGDGANDGPSLREADIGVAMGLSGTDVAREASDMVLLDDSFASIVKAVRVGRAIYDNLREFITYVFTHNWAELVPFILYIMLGIPLPLTVLQILAIDLVIDIIPSLALSQDPPEVDVMDYPPRSIKERLFSRGVILRSLFVGLIITTGALFGCLLTWWAGGWYLGQQLSTTSSLYIKGTTMTCAGIVVGQTGNVLSMRTKKISLFKTNLMDNKWVLVSIVYQIFAIFLISSVPFMQNIFGTTALNWTDWAYLALIPCAVILGEELRKWGARRLDKRSSEKRIEKQPVSRLETKKSKKLKTKNNLLLKIPK